MFFEQAKWLIVTELVYVLLIIAVCIRIIWDTRSVSKTLAYLLFVVFVPVFGVIFYFSFGINYRKRKIYNKKLEVDQFFQKELELLLSENDQKILTTNRLSIKRNRKLIRLLSNQKIERSYVLPNSEVKLLNNRSEERRVGKECRTRVSP